MEHDGRPPVATFFVPSPPVAGDAITLGESIAHHARVKRLVANDPLCLTDGAGVLANARLAKLRRDSLDVVVDRAWTAARPSPIHLFVPIADRDRMLWLAEKVTELGITTWQPVRFRHSASVSPRGEGKAFASKVRTRMIAALEQSGGAWLPELRTDTTVEELPHDDRVLRIVLHAAGGPLLTLVPLGARRDVAVLFGPEGGLAPDELELLGSRGWRAASLAPATLRFETAGVAAVAVLRAASLKET